MNSSLKDDSAFRAEMAKRRRSSGIAVLIFGAPAIALVLDNYTHIFRIPPELDWLIGSFALIGVLLHSQLYRCAACGARVWNLSMGGCPDCGRDFGFKTGPVLRRSDGEEHLTPEDRQHWSDLLVQEMAPLTRLAKYEKGITRRVLPAGFALGLAGAGLLWSHDHDVGFVVLLLTVALPPLLLWFFLDFFVVGVLRPLLWFTRAKCPRCHTRFGTQWGYVGSIQYTEYEVPRFCASCGLQFRK
jgi:hypothetical protein